jgi:hypothetical protein
VINQRSITWTTSTDPWRVQSIEPAPFPHAQPSGVEHTHTPLSVDHYATHLLTPRVPRPSPPLRSSVPPIAAAHHLICRATPYSSSLHPYIYLRCPLLVIVHPRIHSHFHLLTTTPSPCLARTPPMISKGFDWRLKTIEIIEQNL